MEYDASGIRREKVVPSDNGETTTTYIYDGDKLIKEVQSGNSTCNSTYLYNSQGIIGFVHDGLTYAYRKNLFGDIIALYRGATKVAEYRYDAWGNCVVMDGNSVEVTDLNHIAHVNPFRYRGYYWDNDLQLYYLMSRYYDPQTGRFINADSLEYLDPETIGGINLYAYCGNNPVMGVDPLGTISITLLAGLIGFGISFVSSIISQAAADGEVDLGIALIDGVFGGISGALSTILPPGFDVVVDPLLDVANNFLTTAIENKGVISELDIDRIILSASTTMFFSVISMGFGFGFDEKFVTNSNKVINRIDKKLSKNLYKTQRQVINAQKTVNSYISQAFNNKVMGQYGLGLVNELLNIVCSGIIK